MHSIPEILQDLKQGKMIVLVDDEDRENEGDLVCPAEFCTPDAINFMLREGRGMLCVALAGGIGDKLELWPQSIINTSERTTAYTITVDAHSKFGIMDRVDGLVAAAIAAVALGFVFGGSFADPISGLALG